MGTTTSPSRNGSHVDLTPDEFGRRLSAYGHSSGEIDLLWKELTSLEPPLRASRALGFGPLVAVYLGLLLVVTASASLLAIYWQDLAAAGILGVALTYLAAYLVASEALRRRELPQPAEAIETVAVAWVGVATYAMLELAGVWPAHASDRNDVHPGLTAIAVVVLVASAALLAVRPVPMLFVPAAAATALLAVDLAELVYGQPIDELSSRQAATFVLPLGLAWIAAGLWLDATRRRGWAMWAHWCGLVIAGEAVVAMIPKTVPGFALVGLLGAIALFFSAFVRHWSFTIVGALGVLVATTSAFARLGGVAPLVVAVAGLALIAVGLRWARWRETIRVAALSRMPARLRRVVERLGPDVAPAATRSAQAPGRAPGAPPPPG